MKTNYDKVLEDTINELKGRKPSILLHSCCAPCSTAVITRLKDYYTHRRNKYYSKPTKLTS